MHQMLHPGERYPALARSDLVLVPIGCLGIPAAQKTGGRGGDHCEGNEQAQGDRGHDGVGDVFEQLTGSFLNHEKREEHRDGGDRGGDYGTTYLGGAVVGGAAGVLTHLQVAEDIFEHDDGVVDDHADGEGHAGQGDDVHRAAESHEHDNGGYHGHGDCQRDDPNRAQ